MHDRKELEDLLEHHTSKRVSKSRGALRKLNSNKEADFIKSLQKPEKKKDAKPEKKKDSDIRDRQGYSQNKNHKTKKQTKNEKWESKREKREEEHEKKKGMATALVRSHMSSPPRNESTSEDALDDELARLATQMEQLRLKRTIHTLFVVLDTNILIKSGGIEQVFKIREMKDVVAVVPFRVIQELDGLKRDETDGLRHGVARNASTVSKNARDAVRELNHVVQSGDSKWLRVQRADQKETVGLEQGGNADDDILGCCAYYNKHVSPGRVILLTDDKNLSLKASAYDIKTDAVENFLTGPHSFL